MTTRDLATEIRAFLAERGPSTCSEIAAGIRSRYIDVNRELAHGAFVAAATPPHGSPRATYWEPARVSSQPLPASRADRLYSVLKDGRTHSRQEIFDRVGYMLTNNAASELRAKRGIEVDCSREDGMYVYKLVSLSRPAVPAPVAGGAGSLSETDSGPASAPSEALQNLNRSAANSNGAPVSLHLFDEEAAA